MVGTSELSDLSASTQCSSRSGAELQIGGKHANLRATGEAAGSKQVFFSLSITGTCTHNPPEKKGKTDGAPTQ